MVCIPYLLLLYSFALKKEKCMFGVSICVEYDPQMMESNFLTNLRCHCIEKNARNHNFPGAVRKGFKLAILITKDHLINKVTGYHQSYYCVFGWLTKIVNKFIPSDQPLFCI